MLTKFFLKKVESSITTEGRKLIEEFFITFSRFECALKNSIEFAKGNEARVDANWDKFINSIAKDFAYDKDPELKSAVEFLLQKPPKIQNLENDRLNWRNRVFEANTLDITKLCLHIRDIRNNLFHGGKFNGNYERDVSRNYQLLQASLRILNDWLTYNVDIKDKFSSDFA